MFGLLSTAAKSSIRPPMTAGPISRNSSALNLPVNAGSLAASVFAVAAGFSLLLLLFFCSFWPGLESARKNIIEQHARIKRIHFVAMKPPTIFSAAWSGVANDTALDAGMQQMNFRRIRLDPARAKWRTCRSQTNRAASRRYSDFSCGARNLKRVISYRTVFTLPHVAHSSDSAEHVYNPARQFVRAVRGNFASAGGALPRPAGAAALRKRPVRGTFFRRAADSQRRRLHRR